MCTYIHTYIHIRTAGAAAALSPVRLVRSRVMSTWAALRSPCAIFRLLTQRYRKQTAHEALPASNDRWPTSRWQYYRRDHMNRPVHVVRYIDCSYAGTALSAHCFCRLGTSAQRRNCCFPIFQPSLWDALRSVSTTRVHGPSWRPENSGAFFDTRQLGPSSRVVETDL